LAFSEELKTPPTLLWNEWDTPIAPPTIGLALAEMANENKNKEPATNEPNRRDIIYLASEAAELSKIGNNSCRVPQIHPQRCRFVANSKALNRLALSSLKGKFVGSDFPSRSRNFAQGTTGHLEMLH
jgi:hypothetical protein